MAVGIGITGMSTLTNVLSTLTLLFWVRFARFKQLSKKLFNQFLNKIYLKKNQKGFMTSFMLVDLILPFLTKYWLLF